MYASLYTNSNTRIFYLSHQVKGLVGEDEFKNVKEEAEPSTSSPQAITTSTTSSAAHSSGYISPTHNNATSPYNMHYGQSPVDRNPVHMLQWAAFPGLLMPQHPISGHQPPPRNSIRGSSYENSAETSPLSRKKLLANRVDTPILRNVLGQGQADSSQGASGHLDSSRQEGSFCSNSNGSLHDSDRRNSAELSESMMDEDEKRISPHHNYREKTGHKSGKILFYLVDTLHLGSIYSRLSTFFYKIRICHYLNQPK